jgi:hypothetical protein
MHHIGVHYILGTLLLSAALFGNVFWIQGTAQGTHKHKFVVFLDGTNDMDTFLGLWRMIECLVKVLSVRKGEGKLFCWLTLLGIYRASPPMWRRTANKIFI